MKHNERGRRIIELRLSNASGKHRDKRLKRLYTRSAKRNKAIDKSRREE